MNLTNHDRGTNVHVTTRVNAGCRINQGPATIYLDANERGELLAWLLANRPHIA